MRRSPWSGYDRRGRWSGGDAVLCAVPRMRPGTVLGCCVSLLVAGVLLARGFVGMLPSRPVYLILGGILAATALLGLVVDHISVVVRGERPDHVLVAELDRSRRHGHPLSLASVRCDDDAALEVVSHLRTTDRAWRAGEVLYVLLVETDRPGAARFAARLAPLVPPTDVRWASFPTDAVTSDGLYSRLADPSDETVEPERGVVIADTGPEAADLDGTMGEAPRLAGG
ncbi:hypothetical protein HC251_07200 [Iamia sp. SCSIO 61187]|uniref:hypothetical protein n=1 Tax=Iamia sp. SCSIO 61187 TaxID=2722752 RepID=UPI001C6368A8|nr:hypothetical protein [Iamia sp. SCSIO 61187]QYG92244.1 hypothetical protein HC251_07200 [Iamia sp. SCSIO 61187]